MPGTSGRSMRARCMLGVFVVALTPWSAAAGEPTVPQGPLRNALANVRTADTRASRADAATYRRAQQSPSGGTQAPDAATQSPRFFKTRAGIMVAAVMAAGAGYALYSIRHDRIHSPGKQ